MIEVVCTQQRFYRSIERFNTTLLRRTIGCTSRVIHIDLFQVCFDLVIYILWTVVGSKFFRSLSFYRH